MLNHPEKARELNILFNGKNGNLEVDVNDISKAIEEVDKHEEMKFHYHEVDKIIKLNSGQCWSLEEMFKYLKSLGGPRPQQGENTIVRNGQLTGIWTRFSFFNHSCEKNTTRYSIGDFIFVKAKRAIKKGEELTTLYIPYDMPYIEKQRRLSWYQFTCTCDLCEWQKALPEETQGMLRAIWREIMNRGLKPEDVQRKVKFY